ncbi:MAG: ABC transporter permease [Clostridiales bacterium]|nr:ABC transporter permease [Clostridiales bacterium]
MRTSLQHKSRIYMVVGFSLLAVIFIAFFISLTHLYRYDPNSTNAAAKLLAPSSDHLFGTDNLGRDVFSRCMEASKYTLLVSFCGVFIAFVLGTVLGMPAGYFGGITDKFIMLISNSVMCFPGILLALVAVAVFGPSLFNVVWALGLVFAPTFARVYRTGVIGLSSKEYILHAKVLKVSPIRIMLLHMFPNLMPQLLPAIVIGLANMTLFESGMSYLGLGVQPPHASYGKMLADAQSYMTMAPWLIVFPALLLVIYVLGLYFLSEAARLSFGGERR